MSTPTEPIADRLYPSQWVARNTCAESIAKLACTLAGLDPTDEENEPLTLEAWTLLVTAAREHLGRVKEEAKGRGINPVRVKVIAHPQLLIAAVFAMPSAVDVAAILAAPDDESQSATDRQFAFSTSWWAQHALWPRLGTQEYTNLFEGYPGAWHVLAGLARNATGLGGGLKKRA